MTTRIASSLRRVDIDKALDVVVVVIACAFICLLASGAMANRARTFAHADVSAQSRPTTIASVNDYARSHGPDRRRAAHLRGG